MSENNSKCPILQALYFFKRIIDFVLGSVLGWPNYTNTGKIVVLYILSYVV